MFEAHFQTFEETEGGVALTARLGAFREELARRKLTGFVVPRADQQQNEYVAPAEERLAWLTGFTGSAGMAIVLTKEAAVFVDGRYTLQAGKQVDRKAWHIEPLVDPPPEQWLSRHLVAGDRLGFDPWLHTSAATERLAAACTKAGAELVAVDSNPLEALPANGPREHWMRAKLSIAEGQLTVQPYRDQDSSLITIFAAADALLRRPAGAAASSAGELVEVLPLARA